MNDQHKEVSPVERDTETRGTRLRVTAGMVGAHPLHLFTQVERANLLQEFGFHRLITLVQLADIGEDFLKWGFLAK